MPVAVAALCLAAPVAQAGAQAGKMYFAGFLDGVIRRANLDGTGAEALLAAGANPQRIAFDPVQGKMYFTLIDTTPSAPHFIRRANLDGSGVETLINLPSGAGPWGLAIDPLASKMYWGLNEFPGPYNLRRSNLDGSGTEILISGLVGPANAIALDLAAAKIYWASGFLGGSTPSAIQRANLDGSAVETVVTAPAEPIHGIALASGRMYFWHGGLDALISTELDGSSPVSLYTQTSAVYGLATGAGKLYWSESVPPTTTFSIRRANLDGSHVETVLSGISGVAEVALLVACGNGTLDAGEDCDDGNASDGDCCSSACLFEPADSPCTSDGEACTADVCDGAGTCTHPIGNPGAVCRPAAGQCDAEEQCDGIAIACPDDEPAPDGTTCDDGDPETSNDICVSGSCAGSFVGCPASLDASCLNAAKGLLLVRDAPASKEKLIAKISNGPAVTQGELGNPLGIAATAYSLCVYDDLGGLAGEVIVDRAGDTCGGSPCWKALGGEPPDGKGYLYKDSLLASDGVQKILAKGGDDGRSKALVKGAGSGPLGVPVALLTSANATIQFRGSNASQCLSVTLGEIKKQESGLFKAK
jgi:cysteine-rich repeat protein